MIIEYLINEPLASALVIMLLVFTTLKITGLWEWLPKKIMSWNKEKTK